MSYTYLHVCTSASSHTLFLTHPLQAVNNFIRDIGITRATGSVHLHLLDHHVRSDLDANAPRQLAVIRPLRVVIENYPQDKVEQLQAKVFPGRSDETYEVPFSRVLFIEESDFREVDSKDYYGLAPNKSIMLRCACRCHAGGCCARVVCRPCPLNLLNPVY